MTNTIALRREKARWTATYHGPHGDLIWRAFDSRTVPLPYTPTAKAEDVLRDQQRRHADVDVYLA